MVRADHETRGPITLPRTHRPVPPHRHTNPNSSVWQAAAASMFDANASLQQFRPMMAQTARTSAAKLLCMEGVSDT